MLSFKRYSGVLSGEAELFGALLFCFGLLSAITLPSISLGGINVYLVTLVSPILFLFTLMVWLKSPIANFASIFPLSLGLMVVLSTLISWAYGFSPINRRDLFEATKYLQFLPYLIFVPFISVKSLRFFHYAIILSSVWVLLVGILQVSGFGTAVSHFYLGPESRHLDSLEHRITLTGSNPNVGGVIACFYSIFFFSLYSVYRRSSHLFFFIVFFYLCFMTQSRTALIAVSFGVGVYYFLFFKQFFLFKALVAAASIFTVVFLAFYLDLSYIYLGFRYALEGTNNSLNVRFENLYFALQRFIESPFFGVGPAKSTFETTIDSEYALIIQRYGALGVFIFLCYIIYLFRLSFRNVNCHWGISLMIFTLMSTVVMITNNIFSGYQLMAVVVFLNCACLINDRISSRPIARNVF